MTLTERNTIKKALNGLIWLELNSSNHKSELFKGFVEAAAVDARAALIVVDAVFTREDDDTSSPEECKAFLITQQ